MSSSKWENTYGKKYHDETQRTIIRLIKQYPLHASRAKKFGYVESDTPFHQALYELIETEMPYFVAKGRIGNPDDFIDLRLQDLGFFDKPVVRGVQDE